ncbi:oligopeptide transport system permease protein [Salinibacterium sp. CAN_S4]|uniref:ABC transporter permease n=1 Tax=Salinibacterium sp. CAN_S4 TaxID=2787727 RepID=UPI0018EF5C63
MENSPNSRSSLSETHFVASLDETPLQETDSVAEDSRPSNLYIDAWRDVRSRPLFWISGVFILLIIVVSIFPGLFTQIDPRLCDLGQSNAGPSAAHILGTTKQGCDVYARIIFGTSTSLTVGILATIIVTIIGVIFGALGGFFGRWVDAILSRIGDIFFAIPYFLAAVVVMSVFVQYRNVFVIALAIGAFAWPGTARILRGQVLSVKNADYVTSATALGVGKFTILWRHVLPNSIAPVIVVTTIGLAGAIVAEATLSFLGVGLPPSVMSWGNDISAAQRDLRNNPMTLVWPSIALTSTVLAFVVMGEVIRDALDPKARARR